MITTLILLICTLINIVFANILTRVGLNSSAIGVYQWLLGKLKMPQNSELLKLYIVYPKSLVTKSSFALYISQILLFVAVVILFIIECATNIFTEDAEYNICIICACYVLATYLISFGFDRIAQLYYRYVK